MCPRWKAGRSNPFRSSESKRPLRGPFLYLVCSWVSACAIPSRSSSRSVRSRFTSARVSSSCLRSLTSSACSSPNLGSGPPPDACASATSSRARSRATLSCLRSASSSCTRESAGLAGSFDIATEPRLKLAQAQVLHLPAKKACLYLEASDPRRSLIWKAIELPRVNEQAEREFLTLPLDHFLVARHRAASDLDLFVAADFAREHADGTAHVSG